MLGTREPEIYGTQTLEDINQLCADTADKYNMIVDCRQSNHEGDLVDWIQEEIGSASAVIINAAAYTHTSIAIHDALKMLPCPIIEVHLSDPEKREDFRTRSYVTALAQQVIKGKGPQGYVEAIEVLAKII